MALLSIDVAKPTALIQGISKTFTKVIMEQFYFLWQSSSCDVNTIFTAGNTQNNNQTFVQCCAITKQIGLTGFITTSIAHLHVDSIFRFRFVQDVFTAAFCFIFAATVWKRTIAEIIVEAPVSVV